MHQPELQPSHEYGPLARCVADREQIKIWRFGQREAAHAKVGDLSLARTAPAGARPPFAILEHADRRAGPAEDRLDHRTPTRRTIARRYAGSDGIDAGPAARHLIQGGVCDSRRRTRTRYCAHAGSSRIRVQRWKRRDEITAVREVDIVDTRSDTGSRKG